MSYFILFVVLITNDGYESMDVVSGVKHKDRISCLAEKAHHNDLEGRIMFFCGEDTKYFNKRNKGY